MSKNKDNFIDLSNLPMYYKGIDWRNSVGCILKFKYNNIDGELKIVKYISRIIPLALMFAGNEVAMKTKD